MDQIFYRKNRAGLIEAVDMTTNEIVGVQHSLKSLGENSELSKIITPDGKEVWIERGLTVKGDALNAYLPTRTFSQVHADLLIQMIVDGSTLLKACRELHLEYSIVNKWKADHAEFRGRLDQARKDRAEFQHDKILEIAEESKDSKLQIEALKWSTEKNDPDKYSPKTTLKGDKNAPLSFVLSTGIDRGGEPPAETKDITPNGPANAELAPPAQVNPLGVNGPHEDANFVGVRVSFVGDYDVVATKDKE